MGVVDENYDVDVDGERRRRPHHSEDKEEGEEEVFEEIDLLQAISFPFDDPKHIYYADGSEEGIPAFGIRAGSSIMTPFGLLFTQNQMFKDFVLLATVKPADEMVIKEQDKIARVGGGIKGY